MTSERNDEAIAVYDELIQRFNLDETPAIQELVASAFVNKGVRLGHLAGAAQCVAYWMMKYNLVP